MLKVLGQQINHLSSIQCEQICVLVQKPGFFFYSNISSRLTIYVIVSLNHVCLKFYQYEFVALLNVQFGTNKMDIAHLMQKDVLTVGLFVGMRF